jgi:hypothetical protein
VGVAGAVNGDGDGDGDGHGERDQHREEHREQQDAFTSPVKVDGPKQLDSQEQQVKSSHKKKKNKKTRPENTPMRKLREVIAESIDGSKKEAGKPPVSVVSEHQHAPELHQHQQHNQEQLQHQHQQHQLSQHHVPLHSVASCCVFLTSVVYNSVEATPSWILVLGALSIIGHVTLWRGSQEDEISSAQGSVVGQVGAYCAAPTRRESRREATPPRAPEPSKSRASFLKAEKVGRFAKTRKHSFGMPSFDDKKKERVNSY